MQAIHLPSEVSVSHCKGHQKGSTEIAQGNQAADQAAKRGALQKSDLRGVATLGPQERGALQKSDLIGVATLGPQADLPETPAYNECETLKTKSDGFQEDHMGWFHRWGLRFLLGNFQWNLVNFLHATTHLGEKTLQRLLERSFRGIGLQMTIRKVVSSCPT